MESLSPDELRKRLDESAGNPWMTAQLDQQQAALDTNRNSGILYAALLLLATDRGNELAKIMALHHMRLFIASMTDEEQAALTAFTLTDIMMRIIAVEHDGNVAEAVAAVVGKHMMVFEKFVATGGASCPNCGADKGWGDHGCNDEQHVEE